MRYVVIELQDLGGQVGNNVFSFDSVNSAEEKYHSLLAIAAVSQVPCHSVVMLNSEGQYIKSESYKHEVQ